MNILMVCTGNTCRSPMAEAIFLQEAAKRELGERLHADSCGLAAYPGAPASENAVLAMQEQGCDLREHRAKCATADLLTAADRIVCMSAAHAAAIRSALPALTPRITVFDPPIPDPYGGDPDCYRATAAALRTAICSLLDQFDC